MWLPPRERETGGRGTASGVLSPGWGHRYFPAWRGTRLSQSQTVCMAPHLTPPGTELAGCQRSSGSLRIYKPLGLGVACSLQSWREGWRQETQILESFYSEHSWAASVCPLLSGKQKRGALCFRGPWFPRVPQEGAGFANTAMWVPFPGQPSEHVTPFWPPHGKEPPLGKEEAPGKATPIPINGILSSGPWI